MLIYKGKIRRTLIKRVATADGLGFTSIPDGIEEVEFTADVNFNEVEHMARTAARSKGQKCCDGPLVVKVVSRHKIEGDHA